MSTNIITRHFSINAFWHEYRCLSNFCSTKLEDLPDDKNGSQRPPTNIVPWVKQLIHFIFVEIYAPKVTFSVLGIERTWWIKSLQSKSYLSVFLSRVMRWAMILWWFASEKTPTGECARRVISLLRHIPDTPGGGTGELGRLLLTGHLMMSSLKQCDTTCLKTSRSKQNG